MSKFLGQSNDYEDSDGTTAELVLYFTAHRNFKIASTTLFNSNNNRNNKEVTHAQQTHSHLSRLQQDENHIQPPL